MGIKQSINKLLNLPTSMRIEEIVNILSYMGYNLERIQGSHYIFKKNGQKTTLTIPTKHKQVKKIYIKKLKYLYEQTNHQI